MERVTLADVLTLEEASKYLRYAGNPNVVERLRAVEDPEPLNVQCWEAGLPIVPVPIPERDLDLCLMKQSRRTVQRDRSTKC
ncbi:hypothetical protein BV378_25610 [Nostoc sp. RF31YmG]|jgi:hypothetical protein|nr:hypothetical protein BV378_25610 [Nostoc sp. RF31YmG]